MRQIGVNLPAIPIQRQNLQRSLLQFGIQCPQSVQLEWPVTGVIKAKQESPVYGVNYLGRSSVD